MAGLTLPTSLYIWYCSILFVSFIYWKPTWAPFECFRGDGWGCWQLFTVWTDGLCTRGEADMGGCGYSKWSGFVIGRQWLIKLEQEKSYSHYSHPTIYRDTYVIIWILQMGNIAILDVLDQFLQMVPLLFPVISPKNQVNGSAPSTGSSGWPMGLAGGLQIWCRKSAWGKTSFYKWWKTIR